MLSNEVNRISNLIDTTSSMESIIKTININIKYVPEIDINNVIAYVLRLRVIAGHLDNNTIGVKDLIRVYILLNALENYISNSIIRNKTVEDTYGSTKELLHSYESGSRKLIIWGDYIYE